MKFVLAFICMLIACSANAFTRAPATGQLTSGGAAPGHSIFLYIGNTVDPTAASANRCLMPIGGGGYAACNNNYQNRWNIPAMPLPVSGKLVHLMVRINTAQSVQDFSVGLNDLTTDSSGANPLITCTILSQSSAPPNGQTTCESTTPAVMPAGHAYRYWIKDVNGSPGWDATTSTLRISSEFVADDQQTEVMAGYAGGGTSALGEYLNASGSSITGSDANYSTVLPLSGTVTAIAQSGQNGTVTTTLMQNGVATAAVCTMTANICVDTSNPIHFDQYDRISVNATASGTFSVGFVPDTPGLFPFMTQFGGRGGTGQSNQYLTINWAAWSGAVWPSVLIPADVIISQMVMTTAVTGFPASSTLYQQVGGFSTLGDPAPTAVSPTLTIVSSTPTAGAWNQRLVSSTPNISVTTGDFLVYFCPQFNVQNSTKISMVAQFGGAALPYTPVTPPPSPPTIPAPSITSLDAVQGGTGTLVTITGTDFLGDGTQTPTVSFGGTLATVSGAPTATSITFLVPDMGATADTLEAVYVTVGGQNSNHTTFTWQVPPPPAAATYYVSPTGLDTNDGKSTTTPWQTLAHVNAQTYVPGSQILFQGGQTFSGSLNFTNTSWIGATVTTPITIGSYGTGVATINSGTAAGFTVTNNAGFVLQNINFVGAGVTNANDGIFVSNTQAGNTKLEYVNINHIDVTGYSGSGVNVAGNNGNSGFDNVNISYVTSHSNAMGAGTNAGILVQASPAYGNGPTQGWANTNVTIDHCVVHDITGNVAGFQGQNGTGIFVNATSGATLQYNLAYNIGANSYGTGVWTADATNITIQYNEAYNIQHKAGGADGEGFDLDGGVTNSIMQYNYSHGNQIGFLTDNYDDGCAPGPGCIGLTGNNAIRFNISQTDLYSLYIANYGNTAGVKNTAVYNNVFYATTTTGAAAYFGGNVAADITGLTGTFANNIVFTVGTTPLLCSQYTSNCNGPAVSGFTFSHNNWFGSVTFSIRAGGTFSSLSAWGQDANGLDVDPELTNAGAGLTTNVTPGVPSLQAAAYKVLSTSPMLGAGIAFPVTTGVSTATQDFFGIALSTTVFDIGAHHGTGTPPPTPGPAIISVSPSSGVPGTPITITGQHFGATQSTSTVTVAGYSATVAQTCGTNGTGSGTSACWSDGQVIVLAPSVAAGATGAVVITVGPNNSTGGPFTISSVPTGTNPVSWFWPEIVGTDFPSNPDGSLNAGGNLNLTVTPGKWECNSPCTPPITLTYRWHTVENQAGSLSTSQTWTPTEASLDGQAIQVTERATDHNGNYAERLSHWFGPIENTMPPLIPELETTTNTANPAWPEEPKHWLQNGHAIFPGCVIPNPGPTYTAANPGSPSHVWYFNPAGGSQTGADGASIVDGHSVANGFNNIRALFETGQTGYTGRLWNTLIKPGDTVYVEPGWSQPGDSGTIPLGIFQATASGQNFASTTDGTINTPVTPASFTWIMGDPAAASMPVLNNLTMGWTNSAARGFIFKHFGVEAYRANGAVYMRGGASYSSQDIHFEDIHATTWRGHSNDPIWPKPSNPNVNPYPYGNWLPWRNPVDPGTGSSDGSILSAPLFTTAQDVPVYSFWVNVNDPSSPYPIAPTHLVMQVGYPYFNTYIGSPGYYGSVAAGTSGIPVGSVITDFNGTTGWANNYTGSGTARAMDIAEFLSAYGQSSLTPLPGNPFGYPIQRSIRVTAINSTAGTMSADSGGTSPTNIVLYEGMVITSTVSGFPTSVIVHTPAGTPGSYVISNSFTVTANGDYSGSGTATNEIARLPGAVGQYAQSDNTAYNGTVGTSAQSVYFWDAGTGAWVAFGGSIIPRAPTAATLWIVSNYTSGTVTQITNSVSVTGITGSGPTYTMTTTAPTAIMPNTVVTCSASTTVAQSRCLNFPTGLTVTGGTGTSFTVSAGPWSTNPNATSNDLATGTLTPNAPAPVTVPLVFPANVRPNDTYLRSLYWPAGGPWQDLGRVEATISPCDAVTDATRGCPTTAFVDPRSGQTLNDPAGHSNVPGCDPWISYLDSSSKRVWAGGCPNDIPQPWVGATRNITPSDMQSSTLPLIKVLPAGYWTTNDWANNNGNGWSFYGSRNNNHVVSDGTNLGGQANLYLGSKCGSLKDGSVMGFLNNMLFNQATNTIVFNTITKWVAGDQNDIYSDHRIWLIHELSEDFVTPYPHPDLVQGGNSGGGTALRNFNNAVIEGEYFDNAATDNWMPHGSQGFFWSDADWHNSYFASNWISQSYPNGMAINGPWSANIQNIITGGIAPGVASGSPGSSPQTHWLVANNLAFSYNMTANMNASTACNPTTGALNEPFNNIQLPSGYASSAGSSYLCLGGGNVQLSAGGGTGLNIWTPVEWRSGQGVTPALMGYNPITGPNLSGTTLNQTHACIQGTFTFVGACTPNAPGTVDYTPNPAFVGNGNTLVTHFIQTARFAAGGGGAGGVRLPTTPCASGQPTTSTCMNVGDQWWVTDVNAGTTTGPSGVYLSNGIWLYQPGYIDPNTGVAPPQCGPNSAQSPPPCAGFPIGGLTNWFWLGKLIQPAIFGNGIDFTTIPVTPNTPNAAAVKPIADHFGHPWKTPPANGAVEIYP